MIDLAEKVKHFAGSVKFYREHRDLDLTLQRDVYESLLSKGFSDEVTKKILSRKFHISLAEALGHNRLETEEDVKNIPLYREDSFVNFNIIAKVRAYSLDDLCFMLDRFGSDFTLEDIEGYEMVGINTIPDMFEVKLRKGLVGNRILGYYELGITDPEDIANLQGEYVSGLRQNPRPVHYTTVSEYFELGISDVDSIINLNHWLIDPTNVKIYQDLGIKEVKKMIQLARWDLNSNRVREYMNLGINKFKPMRALYRSRVYSDDVEGYQFAGFENPQDMITLKAHNIPTNYAMGIGELGFSGDLPTMIKLRQEKLAVPQVERYQEAGFKDDVDAMIRLTREGISSEIAEGYSYAGFKGNADAMITLHKEGISDHYITAQKMLMTTIPKIQDALLATILSLYHGQQQINTPQT